MMLIAALIGACFVATLTLQSDEYRATEVDHETSADRYKLLTVAVVCGLFVTFGLAAVFRNRGGNK